jgi:hypothetical protein
VIVTWLKTCAGEVQFEFRAVVSLEAIPVCPMRACSYADEVCDIVALLSRRAALVIGAFSTRSFGLSRASL